MADLKIRPECLIWETPAELINVENEYRRHYNSPRTGGEYVIEAGVIPTKGLDDEERAKITTWLVKQREDNNNPCPVLTPETVKQAKAMTLPPAEERVTRLLRFFQQQVPFGETINLHHRDDSLVYGTEIGLTACAHASAESDNQFKAMLEYCDGLGFISEVRDEPLFLPLTEIKLTVEGQMYLEALEPPNTES